MIRFADTIPAASPDRQPIVILEINGENETFDSADEAFTFAADHAATFARLEKEARDMAHDARMEKDQAHLVLSMIAKHL